MGSITSRPELPRTQQPVIITLPTPTYIPAPVSSSPTPSYTPADSATTAGQSGGSSGGGPGGTSAQPDPQAREESLLSRARGRISTVLTGFNGVLSQTIGTSGRKTLLGE